MNFERKVSRLIQRKEITRNIRLAVSLVIVAVLVAVAPADRSDAAARYVFLFIGDGMGAVQRNAAEMYLAGMRDAMGETSEREYQLLMNGLPVSGSAGTDSLSGITDSAASGTAIATGKKAVNGAIAMDPKTGERFDSIATLAHRRGMKVGIVTSSFLQDATPAVFYGHAPKRTEHRSLAAQLSDSGFEYFAGGGFRNRPKKDRSGMTPADVARSKGYRVTESSDGLESLVPGEKSIAMHPGLSSGMMPWAIDEKPGPSLADFVRKGIDLLNSESGFFMMVEGGKIDLACHANDAASAVREVLDFDNALGVAMSFHREHPDDTLIVVTSDHETGGMSISMTPGECSAFYGILSRQKRSHQAFEGMVSRLTGSGLENGIARGAEFFGARLTATEALRDAWKMSMTDKEGRPSKSKVYKRLYGPYDPFTMACMREMNASAGVRWETFYHTGVNVPVSAIGREAETFAGYYENTGIFDRLAAAMSLR
ncbi:MAG: alkaline phosphatase [Synergistaceae bacterium]|jgi:alkaline phosphatase|nr:alkaline phosphatase [Synergistaceae bacterium]